MSKKDQIRFSTIMNELARLQQRYAPEGLCVVYGSQADGTAQCTSDLDLVLIDDLDELGTKHWVDAIVELHKVYNLKLDVEVPHENKLVVSHSDIVAALHLEPFFNHSNEFRIPHIEHTESFLQSRDIRLRLMLNALTTPQVLVAGNCFLYRRYVSVAYIAVTFLACKILAHSLGTFDKARLIDALMFNDFGNAGEEFLGYKDKRTTVSILWTALEFGLNYWAGAGLLTRRTYSSYALYSARASRTLYVREINELLQSSYHFHQDLIMSGLLSPLRGFRLTPIVGG
ncbi:MAG: hypothetical protein KTR25_04305 [Myxococcales bacterium]|nr:hypothetical protein [Myxococcales bacterium]